MASSSSFMIVLENEKTGWLAGHQGDMILSVYDCVLHEEAQIDDYMWLWQMKLEFDLAFRFVVEGRNRGMHNYLATRRKKYPLSSSSELNGALIE